MNKKHFIPLLCAAGALSACADVREGALQIKREGYAFRDTAKELMKPYPPAKPGLKPVRASYCYRVMQDVMCYHEPIPGAESRLVAYQGTAEEEAVTAAAAPDQPQMAAAVQPVAAADTGPRESSIHVPLLLSPQVPAEAPKTETAKADDRTLKSMQRFDDAPPVFVGEGPKVKPDMTPIPEAPIR